MRNLMYAAFACLATAAGAEAQRADPIVGKWRLDSLAVGSGTGPISDSLRAHLQRQQGRMAMVNESLRSGALLIVTEYANDATWTFTVTPQGQAMPGHTASGQWTIDPARVISCPRTGGGSCTHHRAAIVSLERDAMRLRLEMNGESHGLVETFWLTRIP